MVNISWIMQFLEIADRKSINKAAEHLYITQSVLSRNMKALEKDMGYALMERSNQGIRLTKEGRLLYQYGQSLSNEMKVIESLRKTEHAAGCSELNLYLFALLMKSEPLMDYIAGDDSTSMTLKIYEVRLEELLKAVQEDKFAVGVAALSDLEVRALKKKSFHKNLSMEVLDRGGLYLQTRDFYPGIQDKKVCQALLEELRFVHLDLDTYSILRLGVRIHGTPLTDLKRVIIVNSYPMLVEVLSKTNSFSIGNKWQIEAMERHGIKCMEIPDAEIGMNLVLFQNKSSLSSEVENFVKLLKKTYHIQM